MSALLRKVADGLINLSATIGALGLLVQTVIILIDVIGRALGKPLYGSQDLITMTMVIIVFGGMALCDRNGSHVSVDLLEQIYPAFLNRLISIAGALFGAIIFFSIAYAINESAKLSQMLNLSTNLLRLPKAWFQNALSLFAIITATGMALRALELSFFGMDIRDGGKSSIA